jgi:hypothetical protein
MYQRKDKETQMKERLEIRLEELKAEFEKGKKSMEELEAKAAAVRATMMRISGAVQVLEEELGHAATAEKAIGVPPENARSNGNGNAFAAQGLKPVL